MANKQVIAPSSPAAARLAQLAGFNADLAVAHNSLTLASHFSDSQDKTERNLVRPLVIEATVAYGRCFTTSHVRPRLDTIIRMPDEYAAEHDMLMRLRHGTVAHSESNLTPSYAVVNLDRNSNTGDVRVLQALAMTSHTSFSSEAIQLFNELAGAMRQLLFVEIEFAKADLIAELNRTGHLDTLWAYGMLPQLASISLGDWDVYARRPEYPDSHVIPMLVAPARTYLTPSAGRLRDQPSDAE
jgi:hypothetical protein